MTSATRRSAVSALLLALAVSAQARQLLQAVEQTEDCCARLENIGWNGSLPVVIIDSSEPIPLDSKVITSVCTCDNGVSASYRVDTGVRGNSSKKAAKKCDLMCWDTTQGTWVPRLLMNDAFSFIICMQVLQAEHHPSQRYQ